MYSTAESLHRLIKEAIDSGSVGSIAEGEAMFKRFRIAMEIDTEHASKEPYQAALLTAVALGKRVFLGGVHVSCPSNIPLCVPLPLAPTLDAAVTQLGGFVDGIGSEDPLITIGETQKPRGSRFNVRTVFRGWRGGIMPAYMEAPAGEAHTLPLSPMLAAALAINEAFSHVRNGSPQFGKRSIGLSLWEPKSLRWYEPSAEEPSLRYLPSQIWLIGLGHLGQAFLWALGLLPYPKPTGLSLVLQDYDILTPASQSTSILTESSMVGQKKTRAMASWAEDREFTAAIVERRFAADFRRQAEEPAVAFCGVDNAVARQVLDQIGFGLVIEAGLGRGYRDFRAIRLHTLPGPRAAKAIWSAVEGEENIENRPAYESLRRQSTLDRCGITLLAGKAVGAPFVGAVAACLSVAELLRLLHGGHVHQVMDIDLQSLEQRSVVVNPPDFTSLNPGYVDVCQRPFLGA